INIKFVFEGEEEIGSPNLDTFVKENKDLIKADLVYTSDGPMHESGKPTLVLGARGILSVEMTARGGQWDNHSGNNGNIAPNPAWELVQLLSTMQDDSGKVLVDGFYDDIEPLTETDYELIEKLPYNQDGIRKQIGLESFEMPKDDYYKKLMYEPTMTINGFNSGYGGEGSKTIIPATATVKLDCRLVAKQDPEEV